MWRVIDILIQRFICRSGPCLPRGRRMAPHRGTIILAGIAAAAVLAGCMAAPPAMPAGPSPLVDRAAQWQGIAEDAAGGIVPGLPPGSRIVIARPARRSAFASRFPDLLAAALIRRGFVVWSETAVEARMTVLPARSQTAGAPALDIMTSPDLPIATLRLETDIAAIGHDADQTRSLLEQGHYTLLASGVYLIERANRKGMNLAASPGWLIGAGIAADLAAWMDQPTPSTELVLGLRVLDGARYVTAADRVYLIRDGDRGVYVGGTRRSPDTITVLYDPRGDALADARDAARRHCAQTARQPMLAARWAPQPDLPDDPLDLATAVLLDDGGSQPRHGARFDCVSGEDRF